MWLQGNACQIPNKRDTPEKITKNNSNSNNKDKKINNLKRKYKK